MLISQHHLEMIILVETRVCRQTIIKIIKTVGFNSWHIVEPRVFAGGLVLLWNATILKLHTIGGNAQGVHRLVEVCSLNKSFVLSAIYASPKYVNRN